MGLLGLTKAGKENKDDILTSNPILYNNLEELQLHKEEDEEDNDFVEINIDENDNHKAVG